MRRAGLRAPPPRNLRSALQCGTHLGLETPCSSGCPEPKRLERTADLVRQVDRNANELRPATDQTTHGMGSPSFDPCLPIPSGPDQLRQCFGVVGIGLVSLQGRRRAHDGHRGIHPSRPRPADRSIDRSIMSALSSASMTTHVSSSPLRSASSWIVCAASAVRTRSRMAVKPDHSATACDKGAPAEA
jgi:hypothetical protein